MARQPIASKLVKPAKGGIIPDVTVTARKNGPLMVQGTITFIDRDGNEQELGAKGPVVLCRCGGSSKKPFCDGTHRADFQRRACLGVGRSACKLRGAATRPPLSYFRA